VLFNRWLIRNDANLELLGIDLITFIDEFLDIEIIDLRINKFSIRVNHIITWKNYDNCN